MIIYESNKSWWRDFGAFKKSWTIRRLLRMTIIYGLVMGLLEIGHVFLPKFEFPSINITIFSLLGIVLSITLVFRTNCAYDRWWEGRKLWGALVNHCRNLAIQTMITFPVDDKSSKEKMAVRISNFCLALVTHLREGVLLEDLIHLTDEDRAKYEKSEHVPATISLELHQMVEHYHKEKIITGEDHLNFKPHLQALLDICGGCERIRKTPIPFSYSTFLRVFILIYSVLLPFVLVSNYGFWSVPLAMMVLFAFAGLEMMAEEIEDPFGLDCNDLPTHNIAMTISRNVFELLEVHENEPVVEEHANYDKIF